MERRDFLRGAAALALAPAAPSPSARSASAAAAAPIPDEYKVGGWAIGCQAYSFNRFTAFEAIEKTAQAGGKVIEFYPGQKLSADTGEARLDHGMSDENMAKLREKLAKHKVLAVNYGVVDLSRNEERSRRVFEFAKKMGIRTVTSEPGADAMDTIEKLCKEYDIRMAIHNHPRDMNNPNYKIWDPEHVLSLVKGRDARVGACADTGHWLTSGVDPLKAVQILRGRVLSSHLKDRPVSGRGSEDIPFGTGVGNIPGILDELRRQNFDGNLSIEYEANWENNVPDIAQCVGFVRGYGHAKGHAKAGAKR